MFLLLFTRCFTSVRRPATANFFIYVYMYYLLQKYATLFFCDNLVDFNEALLDNTNFFHLSIASNDGKQHLREFV